MTSNQRKPAKVLVWLLAGLCVVGLAGAMIAKSWSPGGKAVVKCHVPHAECLRLVPGSTNTLELSTQLVHTLGVRTVQAQSAGSHDRLTLSGSLMLDANRMVRVHSRFPGEVVLAGDFEASGGSTVAPRPLQVGDRVTKGQLLAVIWSKEVGEKKSDLVNALSKYYLDKVQLESLRKLDPGVVAQSQVREAETDLESDIIEVDRIERTLRSWRLTEDEIKTVRGEADKIHHGEAVADRVVDRSWAKVEVRCPFDGIVLEKNIVPGDIVDTSLDLYKIADLSVLAVMANISEEDLPALDALKPQQRRWTIYLKSQPNAPGIPGAFDLIGNIVDPNQHTAAVMGWLDNKDGRLRDGQFITAIVDLPATTDEVMIPETALVEDGTQCIVFVASSESGKEVTRRKVAVASRGQEVVFVRSDPTPEDSAKGCEPLKPGEWVVAAGSVELDGALDSALATVSSGRQPVKN